jgi:hypothetical protein
MGSKDDAGYRDIKQFDFTHLQSESKNKLEENQENSGHWKEITNGRLIIGAKVRIKTRRCTPISSHDRSQGHTR